MVAFKSLLAPTVYHQAITLMTSRASRNDHNARVSTRQYLHAYEDTLGSGLELHYSFRINCVVDKVARQWSSVFRIVNVSSKK